MREQDRARIPAQTAMEVMNRVLTDVNDISQITIICQTEDGDAIYLYSNARSSAELSGMLILAQQSCEPERMDDSETTELAESWLNGEHEITEHELAELRQMDDLDAATILDARIRHIEQATRRHFVEVGLIVLEVDERQLWRKLSPPGEMVYFRSLGAWMVSALGVSRSSAYDSRAIVERLAKIVRLDDLREMPRCNAKKLLTLSTAVQRDPEIIEAAKMMSEEEFVDRIQELHPNQHVEQKTGISLKPTKTDRDYFDEAIAAACWAYEVETREEALANIVAFFMDGNCEREGYTMYTNRDAFLAVQDRQARV